MGYDEQKTLKMKNMKNKKLTLGILAIAVALLMLTAFKIRDNATYPEGLNQCLSMVIILPEAEMWL